MPPCSGYKGATIVLAVLLAAVIVVFVIMVGIGYIHFGTPPTPKPIIQKRCVDYAENECEGSLTVSGQLCVLQNGICTEYIPPGPPSIPQLNGAEIGAWFTTHPNVPATLTMPPQTTAIVNPNTYNYSLIYKGIDQRGSPAFAVVAQRTLPDGTSLQVQNTVGFNESLAYTQVAPIGLQKSVDQVTITADQHVAVAITSDDAVVVVDGNLGVIREDGKGAYQRLPSLPPPIRPTVSLTT